MWVFNWLINCGPGLRCDWLWVVSSGLELGCQSPQGERWVHVAPVICLSFYPRIPLSSPMPSTATFCPCLGHFSGARFLPSFSAYVSVFTCAVACSSVCPVLARVVFNNVRAVAFSRYNTVLLTNLKDLSLIEPIQRNRNISKIKRKGNKRGKEKKNRGCDSEQWKRHKWPQSRNPIQIWQWIRMKDRKKLPIW